MTDSAESWRTPVTLPDGRVVEYVLTTWGTSEPDDPPDAVPMNVTVTVDGAMQTVRVFIPNEQVIAALDPDQGGPDA